MDLAKQIRDQKTILLPIDSLKPYEKNARTHSKAQVDKLAKMISTNGFLGSILINNEKDRRLIVGHGRLMAAKALGLTELPCTTADHLTEAQIKAHCIADNQIALDAGWDMEMLKDELNWLDAKEYDLSLTGFDENTLDSLLAAVDPSSELNGDPDAIPDSAPTRCQPGDVWALGKHRLKCGDSTNMHFVEELMGGEKADMVFTDPPYRMITEGGKNQMLGKQLRKLADKIEHLCDFDPVDFLNILPIVFDKEKMNAYIFCNKDLVPDYLNWALKSGYSFNILFWKKPNAMPLGGSHRPDVEYLLLFRKSGIWNNGLDGVSYSKCLEFARQQSSDHPTLKPVDLIVNEILISSNPGGIVFEFFLGSGSTLVAAEKTGRRCFGIEIDPKYCDIILKRWEDLTGGTAERVISDLP